MTIRSKMSSFYFSDQFYRIIVFNRQGGVIANNTFRAGRGLNVAATIDDVPYLDRVVARRGHRLLFGLHEDTWGAAYRPFVMSLVVGIEGTNLGFIEVQMSKDCLDAILLSSDDRYQHIFFTDEMDLLYTDDIHTVLSYYQTLIADGIRGAQEVVKANGESALVYVSRSDLYDFYLVTILQADIRRDLLGTVLPFSALLLLGGILVAVFYISITARKLTKPLHQLQRFMENTQLDNITDVHMPEHISNDEIETVYTAYKNVLERLNTSIHKAERASIMQLQAQFDLLQAQVNPHFIYNVLNVISSRGVHADDDIICDICSDLAGMLRYAANTKDKYATVTQEAEYLKLYLSLLKHRYDYKLTYNITIADGLYDKLLPRIVLQQFAENAIHHGRCTDDGIINIEITGDATDDGWQISVSDNGTGITEAKMAEIRQSIADVRKSLSDDRRHVELVIGGMGLINTYARLYILYADALQFDISSTTGKGTTVTITIKGA